MRFPFVQFEFTHSVGPPAGRYVVNAADGEPELDLDVVEPAQHDDAAAPAGPPPTEIVTGLAPMGSADVLLIAVRGAPPPRARMFRRGLPDQSATEEPRELSVTLVTAIFATRGFAEGEEARAWFDELRRRPEDVEGWVASGLAMLNLAVSAYRACAADPYVVELTRADARTVRVGYGAGERVVLGDWEQAVGVPAPPAPRVTRTIQLMPTQGMAAVLAGQTTVLESEELVLRVLLDLQHDRVLAAAAGLHAAIELMLGEITGEVLPAAAQTRLEPVLEARTRATELAVAAQRGELGEHDGAELRRIAEQVGDFIDHRRYAPMGF